MAFQPPSPEEEKRRREALEQHPTIAAAARALDMPRKTLSDWLATQRAQQLIPENGAPVEGFSVQRHVQHYKTDGSPGQAWVRFEPEKLSPEEIGRQIRQALDDYKSPTSFPTLLGETDDDLATLYPLADLHLGLLSWEKETGHNYDLKIADALITQTAARLIQGAPNSEQAVILGLGDLLHSDGYDPMTRRSKNVLDVDGRYPRVLYTAVLLLIAVIDMALQKHQSVLVRILPGNHDDETAIAVTLAIKMRYQNEPRVTVDDDPGRFWFWEWGKVLLGATHGDKAKMADLGMVMAARQPEAWGRTKFRHGFTGHVHHERVRELGGVRVESLQSPAAEDAWHAGMGYCSGRSMIAITYHKDRGEILRQRANII